MSAAKPYEDLSAGVREAGESTARSAPDTWSADAASITTPRLPQLLAVNDVAAMFGRSPRTIRRWIARGELPAFQVGRSIFIQTDDVSALISQGIEELAVRCGPRSKSKSPESPSPETKPSDDKALNE